MGCPGRQAHTGLRRKGSSKQAVKHLKTSIKFPVSKFPECLMIEFPGFKCHIFNLYFQFG